MIEDAIRSLFWAIAKLFLSIGDWIYDIIDTVINIDLTNSKVILYTWSFMLVFLSFACLFRIFFVLLQKTADDNEKIDTSKLMKKILSVFLVATLSTTFFNFCLVAPGYIVRTYNRVITYDERMTSSTAVISATAKTPVTSSIDDMSSTDEVISIDTIDEKLNEEENGEYIYFVGYAELLLCLIGSIIVACLQIVLIIDTALRLFLNIFRFIVGFIPISSLVEDNPTCGDWVKDMISDALMMMFIPISLNMVYGLMSTSAFTLLNGIVRIIIFAIALMGISKTGDMIAKYMGASNLSKGGGMGSMMLGLGSMMAIKGAGSIMKGAGKYLPKGAKGLADKAKGVANDMKNNAFRDAAMSAGVGAGLGNAIGEIGSEISQNTKKDNYFVNNNSQETFQGGALNQNMDESVLDQSPTSPSNETNNAGARSLSNGTASGSSGENGTRSSAPGGVNGTTKGDIKATQSSLSGTKYSPVSTGGVGFVDNSSSGHLYKSSGSVYKPNLRDTYKSQKKGATQHARSSAKKQNSFNNFAMRSYNMSELEKKLLDHE